MKFRTRVLAPLAAAALLAGGFGAAQAQDNADLAAIQKAGAIRIGTEGTYAPFSFHDASGKLVGFDVDLGRAVAAKLGVKADFVEGRWDGLIAGLDAKRYDVVINQVGINAERQAKFDFSEPYISSPAVLVVRADDTSIRSFAELKGKKSANTITSNFGKLAKANGAEVVPVQGFNEAIDLLLSRRVEATVNDKLSYLDFKQHKPNAPVKIAAEATGAAIESSGVLLRKGQPALRAAINKALGEIKADGTYKAISERYFGVDVSKH